MQMMAFIEPLSLPTGALVVALATLPLAFGTTWIRPRFVRLSCLVAIPISIAYSLYWSPIWFGGRPSDEYSAWMLVCVVPWSFVGVAASLTTFFAVQHYRINRGPKVPTPALDTNHNPLRSHNETE
jgi:hypothetical protein